MKNTKLYFLLSILLLTSIQLFAQEKEVANKAKTKVLLVAAFHFDNPGLDQFNIEVDDVYTPKRQKEIAELNAHLMSFQPEKIFLEEQNENQPYVDSIYQQYSSDEIKLTELKRGRSETYQVGFKMAKQLGHEKIYAADAPGLWLGNAVMEVSMVQFPEEMKAFGETFTSKMKERAIQLQNASMLENIRQTNFTEEIMYNHEFYVALAPKVTSENNLTEENQYYQADTSEVLYTAIDERYLGAELTGEWYKRNIKIFSNVIRNVDEGDTKIMLLYGQAHIRILKHLFEDHPDFEVVDTLEYLGEENK